MTPEDLLATFRTWIETPWGQTIAILVASVLMAWIIDLVFTRIFERVTSKTKTDLDDRILSSLHRPIYISVFLAGIYFATERHALPDEWAVFCERILKTIALIVWSQVVARAAMLMLEVLSRNRHRFQVIDSGTLNLFENVTKAILFAGAVYLVLLSWDIDATGWIASAGILGLAVGFAAKDTIANLFAGVFILSDKPYRIGDYINLDDGSRGEVTEIGLRTTRLLTRDDIEITIPNAVIGQAVISNENGGRWPKERIRVKVGVAYGSDLDQVQDLLVSIGQGHEEICEKPEPRVRFRQFGESSLDFELLVWIEEPVLRGRIRHELNGEIYKALGEAGIEIPYPKRDLYVHNVRAVEPGS